MTINDIKPYEKNAKLHPPKQLDLLANAIKRFGWRVNVLVNQDGVIIAGHARWEVWKKYQADLKPIWIVDDRGQTIHGEPDKTPMTEEDARAYRLADNKLAESAWAKELLVEELKWLDGQGFDITQTGFEHDMILEANPKDDLIPDTAPTVAKIGDVWALGRHKLVCGDSTNKQVVLALMAGALADMVFTDPPYGVDYEGKTKDKLKIENDDSSLAFLKGIEIMAAVVKPGGACYVCCPAGNLHKEFVAAFDKFCHHSATLIWSKNSMVLGHGDYHYRHEPILYGWFEGAPHKWYGGRDQTTVWDINRPAASKQHPTMKPVELVVRAIKNSSVRDQIILDVFGGSGTTLIAAEKTGRVCYMMELDPKYCDVIINRWESFTGKKAERVSAKG